MKIFKILNKILIIIGLLLILVFIIMAFISKEDKPSGDSKINNKEPVTTTKAKEKLLTDEEVLDLLSIYKDDNHSFIIKDKSDIKYQVERKNLETGEVDMIFEVDILNGDLKIIDIKTPSKVAGGGGGNE